MKSRAIKFLLFATAIIWGVLACSWLYAANITINLVAVNPSATEEKETPVTYYLPKEIDSQDILNPGGLNVDYDIDRGSYVLRGSVKLKPKESKTIKVEVKDIWRIAPEEVEILKKQIEENLALLQGTPYYESGQALRDQMFKKMDFVLAQQVNYSENVERRIEEYHAYIDDINQIRKNAFSIDYLKATPAPITDSKTVKFIIEVKNPSKDETKKITQKHYLPKEVRSEHVLDSKGFDVRFDDLKKQSYLSKNEEFKPGETKKYEITIKDIWHIPEDSVETLRQRAQVAYDGVKDSDFSNSAGFLFDTITDRLSRVMSSQSVKQDMQRYIGTFRMNEDHMRDAEEDVAKLETMLAAVKAKKLEEFEKSKVKNVLQKLQALRGIMAISQAVFGKKPSMNTTWKVIWGILIFVAFFTAIHFFTWWRKSQVMGEDMAIKAGGALKEVTKAEEIEEEKK